MDSGEVLHNFSYMGAAVRGRAFPGFPGKADTRDYRLARREPVRLGLAEGDLVSIEGLGRGDALGLLIVGDDGRVDPLLLDLVTEAETWPPGLWDRERVLSWLAAVGLGADTIDSITTLNGDGEIIVLRAKASCQLWIVQPSSNDDLVNGADTSIVDIRHQPAVDRNLDLPPPLGEIREEFTVDRGTARLGPAGGRAGLNL